MVEYWDVYDENRNKLDKVVKRGDKLEDNEYHLVVNSWIKNNKNEFLITQRAEWKSHPFMWECTGGSALKGETSLEAAVREVKEELGVNVNKHNAELIGTTLRYYKGCPDILDVWLFHDDINTQDFVIQKEEVNDVKWVSKEDILKMIDDNKFEANAFCTEVLNK